MKLTKKRVQELFEYRDNGALVWKRDRGSAKAGAEAGCAFVDHNGKMRHCIKIDKKRYYTYRVIFLYHHGWLPKFLDHIDRDPANNRIENLRPCTAVQQKGNVALQANNKSGYRGVVWRHRDEKWQAMIQMGRRTKSLGYFSDPKEAARAYNEAARAAFGEFAFQNPL